ncbi:MAG: hypothetical protein C0467_10050 [Planctomycetaceae bacterium]|nr:hypothetical protein [Planctomycetaceae bacterium]
MRSLQFLTLVAIGLSTAAAKPPETPVAPKTLMATTGKVVLVDDLNAALGKEWKTAKGKWELTDGVIRGAELKTDMHGAVARHNVTVKDAVIEFSIKLDGTKQTSLSLNGSKGHISRVVVRPTGLSVQKDDQDGKDGPDKAVVLDTVDVAVKAGEWHTIVVELRGPDILATLDGKHSAYGSHAAIDAEKTNLGFTVAGESASFRGLRVWDVTGTQKDWDATRAKLLADKKGKN